MNDLNKCISDFKNKTLLMECILKQMNTGVIIIDKEGKVVFVNSCCEKLLGVSFHKIVGMHYSEAFSKLPEHERFTLITLETGKGFHDIGYEKDRFNYTNVITDTILIRDDNGEVQGAAGIFKDITEWRELQEKLREAEKLSLLGEMAAGMAHEIRNPLTPLKGFMQLIDQKAKDQSLTQEIISDYTSVIMGELERLNGILNDFLRLAKPKNSDFECLSLNEVIKEVTNLLSEQLTKNKVELKLDLALRSTIMGQKSSLKQVLLNLINNAVDELPQGGKVEISTIKKDKNVVLNVSDNGKGIPSELLGEIFQPFFSTKDKGSGLGLVISKRIIQAHKGQIEVYSNPGEGTTFTVLLPLC